MADIYEFHVTGLIGPVVRSALPELTSERDCRRTLLSGSAEPGEVTRILEQLRDSGLLLQHVVLRTENRWTATNAVEHNAVDQSLDEVGESAPRQS